MLENNIKCDHSVNRGRSVLKTSLLHIKHVLSKTQRKRHSDVYYCITSRKLKMMFIIKLMTSQMGLFTRD